MQVFEALFLITTTISIARIIVGPAYPWLRYSHITIAGLVLIVAGLLMQGWRWQLYPALFGFAFVALGALKKSHTNVGWRLLGAVPLLVLFGASVVLAQWMPVVSLPAPSGPYGVGTFEFSLTDPARIERYAPERNRELYVEVWYPAQKSSLENYPVQPLFHDLYEGEFNQTSFLFGYMERIATHSHIQAPFASSTEGPFPVLLFNHALDFGFTSQNLLLMEHLASHGYVVFSIAHPYQTAKVNLAEAGTIFRSNGLPADLVMPQEQLPRGILGTVFEETGDIRRASDIQALLFPMADEYMTLDASDQAAFIKQAVDSPVFEPFKQYVTEELLADFIYYDYLRYNSLVQYWVEDNQFIADALPSLDAPVAGFSEVLDLERMGVLGMSFGGAAAGEFCKIDSRCDAGINLDGSQFGAHWNQKLPVPFLMFYNDEAQGGNDFAYLPALTDYWDYRVQGVTHMDFTDFAYLWPILDFVDFSGSVEGFRMMEIINTVQLDFLDHHLKGRALPAAIHTDIPEIVMAQP